MKILRSMLGAVCLSALFTHPAVGAGTESPQTLRVDYIHSGNALNEQYALVRVLVEPLPWPGNPARPLDTTNRGVNLFEVVDPKTNRVLYSRGYSTVFGEWQTTEEAQKLSRGFEESLRFPMPDQPIRVRVLKRDDRNAFSVAWTLDVDPASTDIIRDVPLDKLLVASRGWPLA